MRIIIFALWLGLSVAAAGAQESAPRQVKVLVVLGPDSDPFGVRVYSRWDYGIDATLTGVLPQIIHDSAMEKKNKPLAEELNRTLAGFQRAPALAKAFRDSFLMRTRHADVFQITVSQERERYFTGKNLDDPLPTAAEDGFDYLIEIDESFAGLSTLDLKEADVITPSLAVDYRLIDAATRQVLLRSSHASFGLRGLPSAQAVRDRANFEEVWASISTLLASAVSGELNRLDHLHRMAASVGRGDEVPAIKSVLDRYPKMFRWNFKPVKGWKRWPFDNKFVAVLGPKDVALNQLIGLRFEMEPLVPEFGTDVRTVEEYVRVLRRNWLQNNPGATPLTDFDDIDAPGFEALVGDLASGSRNVILLRQLNESFVQIVILVFVKDFETLYPLHRRDMEQMIMESRPQLVDR